MKSKFDPQKHHRRSIRLKGYDYSQTGAYYVTIVTFHRDCLFGEIVDGEMYLNEYGEIVQKWWDEIPIHFPNVELGAFVIMPNHVHVMIETRMGFPLQEILHSWKSFTANQANKLLGRSGEFWQREYFDRYIRNAEHYVQAVGYIEENPVKAGLAKVKMDWPWSSERFRNAGSASPGSTSPGSAGFQPAS